LRFFRAAPDRDLSGLWKNLVKEVAKNHLEDEIWWSFRDTGHLASDEADPLSGPPHPAVIRCFFGIGEALSTYTGGNTPDWTVARSSGLPRFFPRRRDGSLTLLEVT
jgi:hypothetical protein